MPVWGHFVKGGGDLITLAIQMASGAPWVLTFCTTL